jgi:polyphosphate glucokinase
MTRRRSSRAPGPDVRDTRGSRPGRGPRTLAIDIGGTTLKASVLDRAGRMIVERARLPTPYPCPPKVMLRTLAELVAPLPAFDRISIGFPGVVRDGHVVTAPHFGNKAWGGYPLAAAVAKRLERPARLLNDAEVQGLGIIAGRWLEVVLTLGTGVGSAVFVDGWLAPHLELAQHPLYNGDTYNEYVGNEALHRQGKKKWNRRVLKVIGAVNSLLHYDVLYLGGGNAQHLTVDLPRNVRIASNANGITGGIHLWDEAVWRNVRGSHRRGALEHRQTEAAQSRSSVAGEILLPVGETATW